MSQRITLNQREIIAGKSTITQQPEYLLSTNGALNVTGTVTATVDESTLATSANQVGGNQKTQIVDGSGSVIGSTSNALDINIKSGNPTSITANAGTNLNTSALALESGGNLATVAGAVRAEDTASADADKGIGALAIRKATPANTSGTDGDYEYLQISAGRLWASATIDTALPTGANAIGKLAANSGVIIGDVNVVNSNVSTNTAQVGGTATDTNSGNKSAGTQRVVLATDQPALSNALSVDTELPAAAALADATANPTVPSVGSANEVYNGSTWDRARVAADGLTVTGVPAAGIQLWSTGSTYNRWYDTPNRGDANGGGGVGAIGNYIYNATNWDRMRTAAAGGGSMGTVGVLGAAPVGFDGTNYVSMRNANGRADATDGTGIQAAGGYLFNNSTWDRLRSVINATNSIGTGIIAVGNLAQFDDVSPTAITENQFGNLRMSTNRNLYGTIRDAAGNERGVNVNASNQLEVNSGGVANTALNTYATRITTNTTTTPTSSTAYVSSITITTEVAGTTSTVTIRDKQGTPQVLVNGLTTTAASLTPTVLNFQTPVKMTSGIDIVTAGAVAGTVDVWVNYFQ